MLFKGKTPLNLPGPEDKQVLVKPPKDACTGADSHNLQAATTQQQKPDMGSRGQVMGVDLPASIPVCIAPLRLKRAL